MIDDKQKQIGFRRLVFCVALLLLGFTMPVKAQSADTVAVPIKAEISGAACIPDRVSAAEYQQYRPDTLVPVGRTIGVKLFSEGVMVVGFSEITTREGTYSPAEKAGLKKGDIITSMDGCGVETIEQLTEILKSNGGNPISIQVKRNGKAIQMCVEPAVSADAAGYKFGVWIRDSMAGIGTMTFYDPNTKMFGALGHGVNDADTSMLVPLSSGSVMDSSVVSVKKGEAGCPGELQGAFDMSNDLGSICANTDCGIFGCIEPELLELGDPVGIADKSEITIGRAQILSNIEGKQIKAYDIEIVKLYPSTIGSQRGMMIQITDEELIKATGGIVQGMSGSPIIQNGKIIGAVTHVLVKDPTRGYGIFIGSMLDQIYNNCEEMAS